MIRHYEEIGLVRAPRRTASNYRTYSASDVHVLRFVKRARTLGFSTMDIKDLLLLWQNKSRPTRHCQGDERPECPILDDLAS